MSTMPQAERGPSQVQGSCYKKLGYLLVNDQQDYSDESLLPQHRVVDAFGIFRIQ